MLLAWMLLATIGTFIPRYMKEIFKDKIVCQVHAWFAVSRKCKLSFQFDIPRITSKNAENGDAIVLLGH